MEIVILLALIVLNAFFAASEIALISLNDNKIKHMAEEGHKKAMMLQRLLSEPSRFLATIQIGITLAGFMASAFASGSFADDLAYALIAAGVPVPEAALNTFSVVLITLLLSYFTLVLGELVPKRLAMKKAETIAMLAARPLTILSVVSAPFVKLLTLSTNVLVRLFGVDPNADDEQVTEEEIRMMVDVGEERGAIQENEKMMINNIFDLDTKTVSDIMTHRTDLAAIPVDATYKDVVRVINEEKYTRLPVYESSVDNIVGVLHAKDIVQHMETCDEESFDLGELLRRPLFVPTSRRIDELFKDFQKHKTHFAVAIDEYGGTAGIVTVEDLLEEIVGSILDEYDEEEDKEIELLDDHTYLIKGEVDLDVVQDVLDIELPTEEYDTLSGFIIGELGTIPTGADRASIERSGYAFEVQEMNKKRIAKVKVSKTILGDSEDEGPPDE
ncbi:HlyC/CorC family transporter [Paenibacillus antri]|uniref:HlyC/CorC family transporter n=1 Tax=Paenibacillus antri TaxID=2582848 RepID=A0A5R9GCU0_9BACL|nr:hemolysin family protein [Paenibacillus antri]TLS50974.1 HlyC/CorC family transporter [Paenibacillus antri]